MENFERVKERITSIVSKERVNVERERVERAEFFSTVLFINFILPKIITSSSLRTVENENHTDSESQPEPHIGITQGDF